MNPSPERASTITLEYIVETFGLEPLPVEGGLFARYYRSPEFLEAQALPRRYAARRALGTGIYFSVQADNPSLLHRLQTDEIYHFYLGEPVSLVLLYPDGAHRIVTLGQDYRAGQLPAFVVPRDVWQGVCMNGAGAWAFLGCTMAPGYEDKDFELGTRDVLLRQYPAAAEWVERLTPKPLSSSR